MAPALSVREQLEGRCVLITGGLGFLGSVCLEQLLRLSEVKTVYLLVRGKKNVTGQQRVQKVLCGPLFHKLHTEADAGGRNPFSKVQGVEGDMELPGLGLSSADRQMLVSEVDVIIHSAASLTLDAHIQDALRSNFLGTKSLLQLAGDMDHLEAFVHVSTYFVNNFKPFNTPVTEEVHYPTLQLAGDSNKLTAAQLVDHVLTVDRNTAAAEVTKIMSRLNFVSTYAFSKLLTEQLVDDPNTLPGVAKVIIRPSLISPMAGAPYPGFSSGYAGCPGYCLAYGAGCFHDIHTVAFASDAIPDLIPVDTTAALTIAAAAGACAHGPYGAGRARVYHSASAESYPHHAPDFFNELNNFWTRNPPPFSLPFTRYPTYSGRHTPTLVSMWLGTMITSAKVWAAAQLLKWSGKPRQATALVNGFKAFCVQNTPGYARSIVSRVDNARELEASLVAPEADDWRCVWEQRPGMLDWEQYSYTALAGLRTIALRMPEGVVGVSHIFSGKQGLSDPSLMQLWMSAGFSRSTSSSNLSDQASVAGSEDLAVNVDVCPARTDGLVKRAGAVAATATAAAAAGGSA